MRPENKKMQQFLQENGVTVTPKYISRGSLRGCWRLHNLKQPWNTVLIHKLTILGFTDFDGAPLHKFSGNGGFFAVFVRGHKEFLTHN